VPALSHAKSSLTISLHPAARDAYDWLVTYPRLIDWSALPSPLIDALVVQPLHGVMRYEMKTSSRGRVTQTPTEFQFYAPLWPARYWSNSQPPAGTLLIHDDASADSSIDEIEKAAWLSVLQLLLFSVDSNSIAKLRDNLQELLPEQLSRSLFGKKKVSDADLCRWTGLSRSALIQQRQRFRREATILESENPLARLAKPWSPGSEKIL